MIAMTINEQTAAARDAVATLEAEGIEVIRAMCGEDQERPMVICLERTIADRGREECQGCRLVWRAPETYAATADDGACRWCGCTDIDACIDVDGLPCFWVSPGLCSACARSAGIDVEAHRALGCEADISHAIAGTVRGELPR